jgi:hypothetical protein
MLARPGMWERFSLGAPYSVAESLGVVPEWQASTAEAYLSHVGEWMQPLAGRLAPVLVKRWGEAGYHPATLASALIRLGCFDDAYGEVKDS